jgi:hypothetical protein
MLKIFKNKKAQNTAEYAILIALVIGGVIAMQTYAQRALQGRLRDASVALRDQTTGIAQDNGATTLQYEPYYQNTSNEMDKSSTKLQTANSQTDENISTKKMTSTDETSYNGAGVAASGGAGDAAGF